MKVLRGSGWDTSRTINFILGRTTYIETFLGSFKSGRVKVHISPSLSRHAVDVKVKKENEVVGRVKRDEVAFLSIGTIQIFLTQYNEITIGKKIPSNEHGAADIMIEDSFLPKQFFSIYFDRDNQCFALKVFSNHSRLTIYDNYKGRQEQVLLDCDTEPFLLSPYNIIEFELSGINSFGEQERATISFRHVIRNGTPQTKKEPELMLPPPFFNITQTEPRTNGIPPTSLTEDSPCKSIVLRQPMPIITNGHFLKRWQIKNLMDIDTPQAWEILLTKTKRRFLLSLLKTKNRDKLLRISDLAKTGNLAASNFLCSYLPQMGKKDFTQLASSHGDLKHITSSLNLSQLYSLVKTESSVKAGKSLWGLKDEVFRKILQQAEGLDNEAIQLLFQFLISEKDMFYVMHLNDIALLERSLPLVGRDNIEKLLSMLIDFVKKSSGSTRKKMFLPIKTILEFLIRKAKTSATKNLYIFIITDFLFYKFPSEYIGYMEAYKIFELCLYDCLRWEDLYALLNSDKFPKTSEGKEAYKKVLLIVLDAAEKGNAKAKKCLKDHLLRIDTYWLKYLKVFGTSDGWGIFTQHWPRIRKINED